MEELHPKYDRLARLAWGPGLTAAELADLFGLAPWQVVTVIPRRATESLRLALSQEDWRRVERATSRQPLKPNTGYGCAMRDAETNFVVLTDPPAFLRRVWDVSFVNEAGAIELAADSIPCPDVFRVIDTLNALGGVQRGLDLLAGV